MKKLLILGSVFVAVTMTSCTKDRVCSCTYDYSGTAVKTESTMNSTKSVAEAYCLDEGLEIVEYKVNGAVVVLDTETTEVNNCTLD
ncbi:MAG: hypothetical protein ACJAZ2_000615 [Glaciecola sp.]|jgi:hypothetical protein